MPSFREELEETMLGIVTCFFNPCGYKRNVENYFRFRDALGHDLVTVELSFNGKFVIPDAIQLQGDSKNIMWQKERLLNIGIESLPDQYDKVAWLDADLLFLNPNWYQEAEEQLEHYPVVQLFENIQHIDSKGHVIRTQASWMKGNETNNLKRGKSVPGGAWAARRDVLFGGLLDIDVTGGNDTATVDCWLGDWNSWMFRQYSSKWRADVLAWGKQQFEQIKGQLGYLSGDIVHLYHGSNKNRLYGKRASYLIDHHFDPTKDITKDENGLWRWNSDKPEMHRKVANYFALRREDDIEEIQEEIPITLNKKQTPKKTAPQKPSSRKRNVTNWSVGITTAPRKQPTLERTLNSLANAGWKKPHLFAEPNTIIPDSCQHLPITKRHQTLGAFPNWYLALSEMVLQQPQAEAFFICQDDVLFSAGLRDYLEQHLWSAAETGVVSVYCPSHYANGKPEGFHIENRGWKSWGALAYIFPNRSARRLLSDPVVLNHRDSGPASGLRNVDSVVGAWCQRAKLQYIVHSPSLAQHIGDTSTIWTNGSNNGRRRANTFCETLT